MPEPYFRCLCLRYLSTWVRCGDSQRRALGTTELADDTLRICDKTEGVFGWSVGFFVVVFLHSRRS